MSSLAHACTLFISAFMASGGPLVFYRQDDISSLCEAAPTDPQCARESHLAELRNLWWTTSDGGAGASSSTAAASTAADVIGLHLAKLERFPFLCTCYCVHYNCGVNGVSSESDRLAS